MSAQEQNIPQQDLDTQVPVDGEEAMQQEAVETDVSNDNQPEISAEQARIAQMELEIIALQEQVNTEKDKALRSIAECDNVRRRAALDVDKANKFALERFTDELLPVIDSLEMALEHADKDNEIMKPMAEGVELTLKAMIDVIGKFGVKPLDPKGEAFDPNCHQALSMIENAEVKPNTVLHVMQKGYELNSRVIRPAMVMVAKAPASDTQAS